MNTVAPPVHLHLDHESRDFDRTPCGVPVVEGRKAIDTTSSLGLVTCAACRDVITIIGERFMCARRVQSAHGHSPVKWLNAVSAYPSSMLNGTPPASTEPIGKPWEPRVLEELQVDGTWRYFRLEEWLRKNVGDYAPRLRVRLRSDVATSVEGTERRSR